MLQSCIGGKNFNTQFDSNSNMRPNLAECCTLSNNLIPIQMCNWAESNQAQSHRLEFDQLESNQLKFNQLKSNQAGYNRVAGCYTLNTNLILIQIYNQAAKQ